MASHKIAKNGPADEIELSVAQALFDLENNVADLKKDLKALQISSAKVVSLSFKRRKEAVGEQV
jgi:small subunit ribosomal protein S7e